MALRTISVNYSVCADKLDVLVAQSDNIKQFQSN